MHFLILPQRILTRIRATLGGLAAIAILGTVMVTVPQTPLNAQGDGGAKNAPENLRVLTPENFMAQMRTFPVALGVENQGLQLLPRDMLEMVRDINAKFGDGKVHVSCWTCYLGSTKPEIDRIPK
jgi:hypothetical protein